MPSLLLGPLDHALIEEVMAGMEQADRAAFWRGHIEVLREALVERGLAVEVAGAILDDHFAQVRSLNFKRQKSEKKRARYPISFTEPPPLGTELMIGKRRAVLVAVEPITRKSDGAASFLLRWDVAGRLATSGLRSASLQWECPNAEG